MTEMAALLGQSYSQVYSASVVRGKIPYTTAGILSPWVYFTEAQIQAARDYFEAADKFRRGVAKK